ncbi:cytochrome P450 [Podospora australis]|uniref:Cytochrome P450 n=1 Tax=Podospora australis TaxID=1536484 RepID=A0AAN7AHU9_9PEZI|nr:cytochrome P450 [Podospora australis]
MDHLDFFSSSTPQRPSWGVTIGALVLIYWAGNIIYNLYFHPLAGVPGPRLCAATRLAFLKSLITGNRHHDVKALHKIYGDIIRTAPDEVTFVREDAWHEVLGPTAAHKAFPRDKTFFQTPKGQPTNLVLECNVEEAARMRQVALPAYSERALMRQEPRIQAYARLMADRLMERASASEKGTVINVVDWANWFAFDLVGELAFGESFGCLEETRAHPWVELLFNSLKFLTLATTTRFYWGLEGLLMSLVPRSLKKMQADHYNTAVERVRRRVSDSVDRDDFIAPMIDQTNNPNFERMTMEEIESTMSLLLIVGSETTGTTLCGTLNNLTQHPEQLRRLEKEVRGAFEREEDMTLLALQNLPFLNAVISEGLRVCHPLTAGILRRAPKGGATVCGIYLPEDTHICLSVISIGLSEKNFHRAEEFLPERFLPDGLRPAEFDNDQRSTQRPFGAGLRSCIGKSFAMAEMRVFLARLVWKFDLSAAPGKPVVWGDLKGYSVVEKVPINIVVKPRYFE